MDEIEPLALARAESLFAEHCVRVGADLGEKDFDRLVEGHPELASELLELQRQRAAFAHIAGELVGTEPELAGAAQRSVLPLERPARFGEFEPRRLLGRGGMGEVWEAWDHDLARPVALKLLPHGASASEREVLRFQREATAAARVRHEHVVAVHRAGEEGGWRYIAQELVPGGRTLQDELEDWRRRPVLPAAHFRLVAERFERIAEGLQAAHEAGIVHRDLKPQNVLIAPDGSPKVADFGLAQLVDEARISRTGEFSGTYLYAAPEQVQPGRGAMDARGDVFSLGAVLYECLTLRRPFEGDSVQMVVHAILHEEPRDPRALRSRVPVELSWIALKALEKRPAHRYGSMGELAQDLRRFLDHVPVRARAPSPWRRAQRWMSRHPTAVTAMGLCAVAFVALALLFARSERLRAEAHAENASREEVIRFLVSMFDAVDPEIYGDEIPSARQVLERAVARLEGGDVLNRDVRARLLGNVGIVSSRLGEFPRARALLEESLELWDELGEPDRSDATHSRLTLISLLAQLGELEAAEAYLAPLCDRRAHDRVFDGEYGWKVLASRAELHDHAGHFELAEDDYRAALSACSASLGSDSADALGVGLDWADSYLERGDLDAAEPLLRRVVEHGESEIAKGNPRVLQAVNGLGLVLTARGRLDEAEELFQGVLTSLRRSLDPEHPNTLIVLNNLARVWEAQGRLVEAEGLYREAVEVRTRRLGPGDPGVLAVQNNLATCLARQGRASEAEALHRQVLTARRSLHGPDHPVTVVSENNLAFALYHLERFEEARLLQEHVVANTAKDDPSLGGRVGMLGDIRARLGLPR